MIVAREALQVGSRVAYEDVANPRREGRIVRLVADEYRVRWDDAEDDETDTFSDLRQHGWHQVADLPGNPFDGADIISVYTRALAHADGELVALGSIATEAGFMFPTSATRALWNLVEATPEEQEFGQSTNGRLWDVLSMARFAAIAVGGKADGQTIDFRVVFANLGRGRAEAGRKTKRLRIVAGPDDAGAPCFTIGFPEDF